MSEYGAFAQFYDGFMYTVNYQERADYLRTLFVRYGVEDGACLLDLGCGTAALTVALAQAGYDMIGVDASPDMLCEARSRAFETETDILFLCQRAEALDLYGTVDAAVSTLDVINHLDAAAVRKAFANVGLFMNPNGVFLFDVNTVYKHRHVLADQTFVYESDEAYCVWQNLLQPDDSVEMTLDIFAYEDGLYDRTTETLTEYAYTLTQLEAWLREADFALLDVFDDLTFDPLREDAQRAVIAARYMGKRQ